MVVAWVVCELGRGSPTEKVKLTFSSLASFFTSAAGEASFALLLGLNQARTSPASRSS